MNTQWCRSGIRRAGINHRVAVSVIEDKKTGEVAYRMDVLTVPGFMLIKVKVNDPIDFEDALEKILQKASYEDADILREDASYLVTLFKNLGY